MRKDGLSSGAGQDLLLIEKQKDGGISTRNVMAVRFVLLTGGPRKQ